MIEREASDLHITAGERPKLRVDGDIVNSSCEEVLTPKDALTPEKVWTFYFTEAGGRIYGLTTDTTVENAERMSTEAQRFIDSLRAKEATAAGSR
jgi:Tfp pilus assembly pilus retraction ATPase PilT